MVQPPQNKITHLKDVLDLAQRITYVVEAYMVPIEKGNSYCFIGMPLRYRTM